MCPIAMAQYRGKAQGMERTVSETGTPEGKVKSGTGQWERSAGAGRGKCIAHRAVPSHVLRSYAEFLSWLLWMDVLMGPWQKINSYLLTS